MANIFYSAINLDVINFHTSKFIKEYQLNKFSLLQNWITSKRATLNYSGKAVYVALMKTYSKHSWTLSKKITRGVIALGKAVYVALMKTCSKHFWKLSKKITCGVIALVKLQSDSSEELFNTKIALSRVSPSKFSERFQNCFIPLLDCKRKYLLVEKQTFHREKQVL